jgi:hypothetical protein
LNTISFSASTTSIAQKQKIQCFKLMVVLRIQMVDFMAGEKNTAEAGSAVASTDGKICA